MEKFTLHQGVVAPLERNNVDTDAIIPKQFLKSIKRTGFGDFLFDEDRYLDKGELGMDVSKRPINPDFVLNQPRYKGASILLAGENFGCGSSREHAPWTLSEYGFRALIAPSFADIFFNNCYKNGLLPIVLPLEVVNTLFDQTKASIGFSLTIDLPEQRVVSKDGSAWQFEITPFRKRCLINGLDDIALTLQHEADIRSFEQTYYQRFPWLQEANER